MKVDKLCGVALLAAAVTPVLGQPAPGNQPGNRPGGPPGFARMQQRMDAQLKEALDVNDEQWKTLKPKIDQVRELRQALATGPMGMMFGPGPGGPGGPGGPPPGFGGPGGPRGPGGPDGPGPDDADDAPPGPPDRQASPPATRPTRGEGRPGPDGFRPGLPPHSEVRQKFEDLQDALDDKDAKPEQIKAKIEALHQARDKAKAALAAAQAALRDGLKPQQEAVLITMGILD